MLGNRPFTLPRTPSSLRLKAVSITGSTHVNEERAPSRGRSLLFPASGQSVVNLILVAAQNPRSSGNDDPGEQSSEQKADAASRRPLATASGRK